MNVLNPPHWYQQTLQLSVVLFFSAWWRHQMETFSALLTICVGNSLVTGEFPAQRPVTRSFDAIFDLRLNEWLSKRSWGWWFEMSSRPLWRNSNVLIKVQWQVTYPITNKVCDLGKLMLVHVTVKHYNPFRCHAFIQYTAAHHIAEKT